MTTLYTAAMLAAGNLLEPAEHQLPVKKRHSDQMDKQGSRGFGFNFGLVSSGYEVFEASPRVGPVSRLCSGLTVWVITTDG